MSTLRAATSTTHLGRYHVVKRLAAGGMADVLLARTNGIQGFERHVVIKRIHAELLDEERYIKMFLDEARLAASLHHQNIVQVNDIGQHDGEYFFAMEYVHGEDARNLLQQASDRRALIPLEHVITIITAAAAGLHHAHEHCGPDRAPLRIVHRDVSPANILIGFDGCVKVADFGIALAAHRAEQTQSGVLKGKVAYMSPEQCNCERVDRRSDVFSLGIVLYELATVQPCFAGDNDFLTMSAIVNGAVTPPSQLNPTITPALEAIIMKALARSADDRYQSAEELRVALESFAATNHLRSSTSALADYMKQQFGTRAMPWLEDDVQPADDLEISVVAPPLGFVEDERVAAAPVDEAGDAESPPELALDDALEDALEDEIADELEIPVAAGASRPSRPMKATIPLRPVKPREAMAALVVDRPLAAPVVDRPLAALVVDRPLAALVVDRLRAPLVVDRPLAAPVRAPATRPVRVVGRAIASRRWWLVGSIVAVMASGMSLVLVSTDGDAARPAARVERVRTHVTPLPAPRLAPSVSEPAMVEAGPDATPAGATTKRRKSKKAASTTPTSTPTQTQTTAPVDPDNWNPDTLFPK